MSIDGRSEYLTEEEKLNFISEDFFVNQYLEPSEGKHDISGNDLHHFGSLNKSLYF